MITSPGQVICVAQQTHVRHIGTSLTLDSTTNRWSLSIPSIHFAKVDVDALPDLAQEYSVRAMPTFHIFKDGEKVDEYVSANPPALLKVIEKWKPAEEDEVAKEEEAKAE